MQFRPWKERELHFIPVPLQTPVSMSLHFNCHVHPGQEWCREMVGRLDGRGRGKSASCNRWGDTITITERHTRIQQQQQPEGPMQNKNKMYIEEEDLYGERTEERDPRG